MEFSVSAQIFNLNYIFLPNGLFYQKTNDCFIKITSIKFIIATQKVENDSHIDVNQESSDFDNYMDIIPNLKQSSLSLKSVDYTRLRFIALNRRAHMRYQCRKTTVLSSHRCLIKTGVEKMNNILIQIRTLTTRCL